MENREKDVVYYEKMRTTLMAAMLAVLVVVSSFVCFAAARLIRYESQIGTIIDRLDTVSAELEKLDTEKLVRTANEFTDAMENADIRSLVESLNKLSEELKDVDINGMSQELRTLIDQAKQSLDDAKESLESVSETIDSMDIEALNKAIAELSAVVEPLARFASRFG